MQQWSVALVNVRTKERHEGVVEAVDGFQAAEALRNSFLAPRITDLFMCVRCMPIVH